MKQQRTSGTYSDKKHKVIFDLSILSYKENDLFVLYAPSLDIFGYGKTESEASDSFRSALEEFIRYTTNKKTIEQVMKQLGWEIKPKKHLFKAPPLSYMLEENEQFNEIFNNKDFRKYNEQVGVPMYA